MTRVGEVVVATDPLADRFRWGRDRHLTVPPLPQGMSVTPDALKHMRPISDRVPCYCSCFLSNGHILNPCCIQRNWT